MFWLNLHLASLDTPRRLELTKLIMMLDLPVELLE